MIRRSILSALSAGFLFSAVPHMAGAQTALDQIKTNRDQLAQQYAEADLMLADTDKNKRIGAMMAMLQSGDPIYQKRARDVGLFSPDPEMRSLALQAILQTGGPFRVDLYLKGVNEEKSKVYGWLSDAKGVWDPQTGFGSFNFTVGEYNPKLNCWPRPDYETTCWAYLTGETISFEFSRAVVKLTLANDGRLLGNFRYSNGSTPYTPVPAAINLIR